MFDINTINFFSTQYHIIGLLIIYLINYLFNFIINNNIKLNWILKFSGSIIGYFVNDIFVSSYILKYDMFFKKFTKYFLLLFFQNLLFNIFSYNLYYLTIANLLKIGSYILIYVLCDKIIYNSNIKNNLDLYADILKYTSGHLIVEAAFGNIIKIADIIYLVNLIITLYIYYNFIDNQLFTFFIKKQDEDIKEKIIKQKID